MPRRKKILSCCSNFDEIVNCDFLEDDVLTKKLIEYYQDFVFNINENCEKEIEMIKKLDTAIHKYIEDYRFAKSLKDTLDVDAIAHKDFSYLEQLMKYIVSFFSEYESKEVRNIIQTKWI